MPNGRAIAKLLVVDDDASIRQLLAVVFSTEGHEVVEAEDGIHACEVFEADPTFDLVVLDVMMPRLDGLGVLRRLRESEVNGDVAVVMLTAKSTKDDEHRAARAGADGYVTKPFDPEMLISLVDVTLMYSPKDRSEARAVRVQGGPELTDDVEGV